MFKVTNMVSFPKSDSIISMLFVNFEDLMFDVMLARLCWA